MEFPVPATITDALVYDPYATVVYNASTSYFSEEKPEKITADKITTLVRNERNLNQRTSNYEICHDKVKDYLVENYEDMGSEYADEIARLLQIDLSKTVEVTFQVEITATISLPVGKDFSDLSEYDFDITLETNEMEYEIDDFDATIERMRES